MSDKRLVVSSHAVLINVSINGWKVPHPFGAARYEVRSGRTRGIGPIAGCSAGLRYVDTVVIGAWFVPSRGVRRSRFGNKTKKRKEEN